MVKKVVAIGGSAGSVVLIYQLLKKLRDDFPYPIFMVVHRLSEQKSELANLFQTQTKIPITEPEGPTQITGNTIFLAAPGKHMFIENDTLINIDNSPLIQFSRPSIDVLFFSASEIFKNKLVGVIVSGTNQDGAIGMHRIKENGGITLVQDPDEAKMARMPKAAIAATKVDYILKGEEIIKFLNKL